MAVSFVAAGSVGQAFGGSSVTPGLPTGWAQNDLLLLWQCHDSSSDGATPPLPTGYTNILTIVNGNFAGACRLSYKLAGSSESAPSWTAGGTSSRTDTGELLAYRGVDQTTPINISNSGSAAAATSWSSVAVTTTAANCIVACWLMWTAFVANPGTITNASLTGITTRVSKFSSSFNLSNAAAEFDGLLASAGSSGSFSGTWSSGSRSYGTVVVGIAPSTGGGVNTGQAVSATLTTTASLAKAAGKALAATATTTATLVKATAKTLSATLISTASLLKKTSKLLSATLTTTASIASGFGHLLTLTATLTSSASLTKAAGKILTAGLTTGATLQRTTGKLLAAMLTTAATLQRATAKALTAALTTAASLARGIGKGLALASLTLSAALDTLFTGGSTPPVTPSGGDGFGPARSPSRRALRRQQSIKSNEVLLSGQALVPVTRSAIRKAIRRPEAAGWKFTAAAAVMPPLVPIDVPSPIRASAVTANMVALAVAQYLARLREAEEQDEEEVMLLLLAT